MMHVIPAAGIAAQAWRNGGGRTRELMAWPSASDWSLRVSLAEIEADGPFSAFPGVVRWFAVVEGAGVSLGFADGQRRVVAGDPPLCFDGAAAPTCRLLDGPTRDLNLMIRGGHATLQRAQSRVPWDGSWAMRGLYASVAGRWSDGAASAAVAAQTLLWDDATSGVQRPWHFVAAAPAEPVSAWWLGCTPADARR